MNTICFVVVVGGLCEESKVLRCDSCEFVLIKLFEV